MIAANELRMGNWVKDSLGYLVIGVNAKVEFASAYEPIPLTPEILEKCGFEKELFEMSGCEVWHVPNTLWRIARSYRDENEYKLWHERISPPTWNLKTLKYLHELQNIIFALTNEELNYTP